MWGWVAKAGAWAWAHKAEISAVWGIYKRLRGRRKAEQKPGESAVDYYKRVGYAHGNGDAAEGVAYLADSAASVAYDAAAGEEWSSMVKITAANGTDVFINPDNVVMVMTAQDSKGTAILGSSVVIFANAPPMMVSKTPSDVAKLLEGGSEVSFG